MSSSRKFWQKIWSRFPLNFSEHSANRKCISEVSSNEIWSTKNIVLCKIYHITRVSFQEKYNIFFCREDCIKPLKTTEYDDLCVHTLKDPHTQHVVKNKYVTMQKIINYAQTQAEYHLRPFGRRTCPMILGSTFRWEWSFFSLSHHHHKNGTTNSSNNALRRNLFDCIEHAILWYRI